MENRSVSGYYVLEKEVRLPYGEKEVLYVVGLGVADTSCCGGGASRYALVPGYVVKWHVATNQDGLPVSEVERISEDGERRALAALIKSREVNVAVQFL